jgi:hypothetical protein
MLADMHGPVLSTIRNQSLLLTPAPVKERIFDAFLDYSLDSSSPMSTGLS